MREAFHTAFAEALRGDFSALAPWMEGPDGELRFSVYRNTVAKGLIEALAAQFPTVAKATGEAWMHEAARRFARRHPPASASLLAFGDAFPVWLETYEGAGDLPWLADLARLDAAWRRSFFAADLAPLPAESVANLQPSQFAELAAEPHPACGVLAFRMGVPDLWVALQADEPPTGLDLAEGAQAMAFVRPQFEVRPLILSTGGAVFLAACAARHSLAQAADAALSDEPALDLTALFSTLITAGAFARLVTANPKD